jgi:hypothetical protein
MSILERIDVKFLITSSCDYKILVVIDSPDISIMGYNILAKLVHYLCFVMIFYMDI